MPLQNRVDPFWRTDRDARARHPVTAIAADTFIATIRRWAQRRWASRQWICCVLSFKGRHHPVWRERYTALFFLDEVTALAAGHRPCFECRRADAKAFAEKWAQTKGSSFPYVDRDGSRFAS